MSGSLTVARLALSVKAAIPHAELERFLPASLRSMGEQLAQAVHEAVTVQQLGYYPALDYFRHHSDVAAYLLDAVDEVALVALTMGRNEVTSRLTGAFSSVRFENVQCSALTMPAVRWGQHDWRERLIEHYTPNRLRLDLELTLLQRGEPRQSLIGYARSSVQHLLDASFEEVEIVHAQLKR